MTSINSNISAYYAQNNLRAAGSSSQSSIARLSSGQKIIKASDDVAGLSVGTILRTNVSTLKTALVNANQGSTLLQIADGALARVGEILQRQKALATQTNSGTLSANEKGYLNQEFSKLKDELDRIVSTTNFNGITLLDGALSESAGVETQAPSAITAVARTGETVSTSVITGGAGGLTIATVGDDTKKIMGSLANAVVTYVDGTAGDDNATMNLEINGVLFTGAFDAVDTDTGNTNLVLTEVNDGRTGFSATVLNLDLAADIGTFGATPTAGNIQTIANTVQTEIRKIDLYQTKAISTTAGDTGAIVAADTSTTILDGLDGDDFKLQSMAFSADGNAPSIGSFNVSYANGGATVSATINGVKYEKELGDLTGLKSATLNGTNSGDITLVSVDDSNSTFNISLASLTGDITIASADDAKRVEDALNKVFGSGSSGGLDFQVGTASTDTIGISVDAVNTNALYVKTDGTAVTMDLVTGDIDDMQEALDNAIRTITSRRADVGALQSRFNYAAATIEVSVQNLDAARAQYLDADISEESTNFAKSQVLQQAAISVLAQANQIPQNLLKLIG